MDFSLLTYNTLFNDAVAGLKKICEEKRPDIVCLQEIDTTEDTFRRIESLGYKLADYSNAFIKYGKIYGVATFYNPEKFDFEESKVIFLPKGILEVVTYILRVFKTGLKNRTVLKTDFVCMKKGCRLTVYNIHLTAHGTNHIRFKQIKTTLEDVKLNETTDATILTGDFNYPIGRRKLEELLQTYQFKEATNKIFFTTEGAMMHFTFFEKLFAGLFFRLMKHRLKLDYIFYKNLVSRSAEKVNVSYSDHYPVFAKFTL